MARWILGLLLALSMPLGAQNSQTPAKKHEELKPRPDPQNSDKEEVPPEEDKSMSVKDYTFNPLQAEHEVQTGNYYAKKGSYRAAAGRYREATMWNATYAEAWLKLGEVEERLRDKPAAREAYAKYLELASEAKNAAEIRKKLEKLK